MDNKHKKVEFLRDYPHPWIFKFEITEEAKEWWYGEI